MKRLLLILAGLISLNATAVEIPQSDRSKKAVSGVATALKKTLSEQELDYGAPIFIRIFKEPGELELWLESSTGAFKLFRKYDICTFSGHLGPKLKQGDNQSPEGFYFVNPGRLNPWSRFHLSFNLGYPNKYDRHHGRTGNALMVHGNCVSIGCYAMTDAYINEIYALSEAALAAGQPFFSVHVFPFRLESKKLKQYQSNPWHSFWLNLEEGYDYFKEHKRPPNIDVRNGKYIFSSRP